MMYYHRAAMLRRAKDAEERGLRARLGNSRQLPMAQMIGAAMREYKVRRYYARV